MHGPDAAHDGNAIVRASCILQLALGNVGVSGGGTNIFRGHDNVQGATDVGPNPDSLPGYYGLAAGSWKHWAAVWGVDYEWIKKQYAEGMMEKPGMTVSRWIDGVLEKNDLIDQGPNLRALVYWGHAPNSQTRGKEMVEAMKKLDLLVVIDPYPSATAAMAAMVRKDGVYLLPACTQFETSGSVTASNRSIQWRERVITPLFESQTDHAIMYAFAKKFGWDKEFVKNYKIVKPDANKMDEPEPESILREINKGTWTIGYTGQSPERLKLHMKNMATFDVKTLRANGGPCDGDYFGLPWPCYGTPELKHPGSPNLYNTSVPMMDGGGCFRANFGVERDGVNLLAEDGSYPKGGDLTTGYPELDHVLMKKLGWWDELTDDEKKAAEGKNWKTDLSGGMIRVFMKNHGNHPFGNAKARAVVWNFPDAIPQHREPLYSNASGSRRQVPDARRQEGVLAAADAVQDRPAGQSREGRGEELPAGAHQRSPGRVRGRRRGDALQPVARRAAAGELHRDQPEGRQRSRRAATANTSGSSRRPARRSR